MVIFSVPLRRNQTEKIESLKVTLKGFKPLVRDGVFNVGSMNEFQLTVGTRIQFCSLACWREATRTREQKAFILAVASF